MEEKKYLGMPKNVCLGLCYLVPVLGLIAFLVEKNNLDLEERRLFVTTIVILIADVIACLAWLWFIFALIAAINYFQGKFDYKAILFYNIACKFVKEPAAPQDPPAAQ